jgi:hypothetical protein
MTPDVLGELVGRVITREVAQLAARCHDMRIDLERRLDVQRVELHELRATIGTLRERLAVLEAGRASFLIEASGDYPRRLGRPS